MIATIDADEAWWPPTFTPDARRAHLVGVVDDARRQPQHAAAAPPRGRRATTVARAGRGCLPRGSGMTWRELNASGRCRRRHQPLVSHIDATIERRTVVSAYASCVPDAQMELDATDLEILELLRDDARRAARRHRPARPPLVAGRQAPHRPARAARGHPRLHRARRPRQAREAARGVHRAALRRHHAGRRDRGHRARTCPRSRRSSRPAGDPDALVWIRVRDVADLKRVVDRLRRSGRVTGTKTLMVLGTSARIASPL